VKHIGSKMPAESADRTVPVVLRGFGSGHSFIAHINSSILTIFLTTNSIDTVSYFAQLSNARGTIG
jgi:hypothetical protein